MQYGKLESFWETSNGNIFNSSNICLYRGLHGQEKKETKRTDQEARNSNQTDGEKIMADIFDVDNQENFDLGQSFEPSEQEYLASLEDKTMSTEDDLDFYGMMAQQTWIPEQAKKSDWKPLDIFEEFQHNNEVEINNMLKWDSLNTQINSDRDQLQKWGKSATNPSHYNEVPAHLQHWDVVEQMGWGYHLGCATKYIWRAGKKASAHLTDQQKEIEDLEKAVVYINKRIELIKGDE